MSMRVLGLGECAIPLVGYLERLNAVSSRCDLAVLQPGLELDSDPAPHILQISTATTLRISTATSCPGTKTTSGDVNL